jgi:hypothetical protein
MLDEHGDGLGRFLWEKCQQEEITGLLRYRTQSPGWGDWAGRDEE